MNLEQEIHQKEFGTRLSILIDEVGGNSEFARKCGFSEAVVRSWRNGISDPSRSRLIKISEALGVNLIWLATGKGKQRIDETYFISEETEKYAYFPSSLSSIPLYDVKASAGHGSNIEDEPILDYLSFKTDWIKGEMGLVVKQCCLIYVSGDSMEPTLHNKDVVLLDLSQKNCRNDGVYCIRIDGSLLIKRLQRIHPTFIKIISDNQAYQPYTLDISELVIIGRVVWAGKRF